MSRGPGGNGSLSSRDLATPMTRRPSPGERPDRRRQSLSRRRLEAAQPGDRLGGSFRGDHERLLAGRFPDPADGE